MKDKVSFKEVGFNLFLIEFLDNLDLQKILEGRSWSFDRFLLSIRRYDRALSPQLADFGSELMWVQMHHLPFGDWRLENGLGRYASSYLWYGDWKMDWGGNRGGCGSRWSGVGSFLAS